MVAVRPFQVFVPKKMRTLEGDVSWRQRCTKIPIGKFGELDVKIVGRKNRSFFAIRLGN